MSLPNERRKLSEADYLSMERTALTKSEFFNGEVFAMAGGTATHSLIATNLAGELRARLKGRPCVPYNADLRVKVEATGLFTYPDVSVVCGEPQYAGNACDTLINPTVLVEVLSDATEAYDRGRKFEHYRQIPSLREYLMVSQHAPRVEQFIRQPDGRWVLVEACGLESNLELAALGITLPLSEVFAHVRFETVPFRPASLPPA